MSQLIGSTSHLLRDARVPTVRAVARFRTVMDLFMANRKDFVGAIGSFGSTLAALGRASSYENAVNIYLCTVIVNVGGARMNLNGGDQGPYSEVCR
jgi:phospholipid/cholesterol/gamma-HCH transport system substrate-binding protein